MSTLAKHHPRQVFGLGWVVITWLILLAMTPALQTRFTYAQPPTPLPSTSTFADSDTALLYGDYESAIAAYREGLNNPALRCAALYGLGGTYLQATQFEQAESALSQYFDECELSFTSLILRGQARAQSGNTANALTDYQAALALNPDPLESYLYEWMAILDSDQSVRYLRLATETARAPASKFALRETLAEIYLLVGNEALAVAEYDALLADIDAYLPMLAEVEGASFDMGGSLRARIQVAAADIEIENDQQEAGYARLQQVISDYPETASAFEALVTLVLAGQPVDLLTRMRINVHNENYFPVVDVLTDYLDSPDAENAPRELYLWFGISQRGVGDTEGALTTFADIQERFPDDPLASAAALEQGQTYADSEDYEQAVQTYLAAVEQYPQSPETPEALRRAADIERDQGNLARALELYDELAARYENSEATKDVLLELGLFLTDSDPALAAQYFGQVGSAEGFFRQGNVLEAAGETDAAREAWTQAITTEPGIIFSMRACEQLNGLQPFAATRTLHIAPIADADRNLAAEWIAQTFNLDSVSVELSPEIAAHSMLVRGEALWTLGAWPEARLEFDTLHRLHRNDPAALLQLAFHYQNIGVYRSSLFAATRLITLSEMPMTDIPKAIMQLAYPIYYQELLVSMSEEYDLDALLVAALIRQESSFDAIALSVADARGLMQFVPSTAQDVALRLEWPDFRLSDLQRPIVSIPFGTYYLSRMKEVQGDSVIGAILSYNAGPGAAFGWLNETGDDFDLLYDTIPYQETRLYLQLIYENYAVYHYLYGDPIPTCMFSLTANRLD